MKFHCLCTSKFPVVPDCGHSIIRKVDFREERSQMMLKLLSLGRVTHKTRLQLAKVEFQYVCTSGSEWFHIVATAQSVRVEFRDERSQMMIG